MTKSAMFENDDADMNFGLRAEGHKPVSFTNDDYDSKSVGTKLDRTGKLIELDRIIAKEQVRKEFNEEKLNELAHSLKTIGQEQPCLVYWSEEDSRYVIVAGERRFRAAQLAGLKHLACRVHPTVPTEAERVELQFVENAMRDDLNPIEEAESYRQLQELNGFSANQLAERIGKNQTTISRTLRLLKLPKAIREQVRDGKIPTSVAREIVKLKNEEEQQKMADKYLAGEITTNDAQAATLKKPSKSGRGAAKKSKKFTRKDIGVHVSYGRSTTQSDLGEYLIELGEKMLSDGRGKKAA